jgi:hypothetical protein
MQSRPGKRSSMNMSRWFFYLAHIWNLTRECIAEIGVLCSRKLFAQRLKLCYGWTYLNYSSWFPLLMVKRFCSSANPSSVVF